MPRTLYLRLQPIDGEWFELRRGFDDPKSFESRKLRCADIQPLLDHGETHYYSAIPDLPGVGRQLYRWLEGDERWLSRAIRDCADPLLVLAIDAAESLAHLPWEALHDGAGFLAGRTSPHIVPVRRVERPGPVRPPAAARFGLLFMATAPEDVTPPLDFEAEEAAMLAAVRGLPFELRVEESGCVEELGKLWHRHPEDRFHAFHLTGHAGHTAQGPAFLTEDLTGRRRDSTAQDLFEAFHGRQPRLAFLSGCRTGEAKGNTLSMAETLARLGVPAVLGWGRPVRDRSATEAAAVLYAGLAHGDSLAAALAETYRHLLHEAEAPDWHLLRLYAVDGGWSTPVEPPGDACPVPEPPQYQFLDPEYRVRVATPEQFVGRRRALQRCLRELRVPHRSGVLLHGLGGVGKSSLAARLLERLAGYTPLVLYGAVDARGIERRLAEQCTEPRGHDILNEKLPDAQRWGKFLKLGLNQPGQWFCFVLDDFEHNLDLDDGRARLKPEAVEPLRDLLKALRLSGLAHRVIVTSRYDFHLPEDDARLYRQGLDSLKGADLDKKCERLTALNPQSDTDPDLRARALRAADGNPRLLDWLDRVLAAGGVDADTLLAAMEREETKFRENVLTAKLLEQLDESARELLARLLVYELPVPRAAVAAVCEDGAELDEPLRRTVALGLLERTDLDGEPHYRAPRVLAGSVPERVTGDLAGQAARVLYRLWWEETGKETTEERALEMVRLALISGELDIAVVLADAGAKVLFDQCRFKEAEMLCTTVLNMRDNHEIRNSRANALMVLGYSSKALIDYQKALELCPETDIENRVSFEHNLARLMMLNGKTKEALALYYKALKVQEELQHFRGQAVTIGGIAEAYAIMGNTKEALKHYQASLKIHSRLKDRLGEATTLHEIGRIFAAQNEINSSLDYFNQALQLWESIENLRGKAASLHEIGRIFIQQERLDKAITVLRETIDIYKAIGDKKGEAASLHEVGYIYDRQEEFGLAQSLYQQSLEIEEYIGNPKGKAVSLSNLATLAFRQGKIVEAIVGYKKSCSLLVECHAWGDIISPLASLGVAEKKPSILAQAVWLSLKIDIPFPERLSALSALFSQPLKDRRLKVFLMAMACYLLRSGNQSRPNQASAEMAVNLLCSAVAKARGLKSQAQFDAWFDQQKLNDPAHVRAELDRRLLALAGDDWLFGRALVAGGPGNGDPVDSLQP